MKPRIPDIIRRDLAVDKEELRRGLRIFVTYALILILLFFLQRLRALEIVSLASPFTVFSMLFSFLMLAYLLSVETDHNFVGFCLMKVVCRMGKYKQLVFISIPLVGAAALFSFVRSQDFLHLRNGLLVVCLLAAIQTGMFVRNVTISMHLVRLWRRTNLLKLIVTLSLVFYFYCFVGLYELVPLRALLEVSVLGFILGVSVAQILVHIQARRALYRDMSIQDWERQKRPQPKAKKIYRMIQRGKLARANLLLLLWKRRLSEKDICKIKCRIWHRRREFDKVIAEADRFLRTDRSDVVLNLKALSLTARGDYSAAREVLEDAQNYERAHGVKERNPYVPLNLGYICWQENRIDDAIEYTKEASLIDQRCPLAWNNWAFFLCEKAILGTEPRSEAFYKNLEEADRHVKQAFKYAAFSCYSALLDTQGLIYLLSDKFAKALECFSRVQFINKHTCLHLGVFFMIDTKTYFRSEYFLTKAMQGLRDAHPAKTYRLATRNLARILAARDKEYFTQDIVFHFYKETLPAHVIREESSQSAVPAEVKDSYMTFNLSQLQIRTLRLQFVVVR